MMRSQKISLKSIYLLIIASLATKNKIFKNRAVKNKQGKVKVKVAFFKK